MQHAARMRNSATTASARAARPRSARRGSRATARGGLLQQPFERHALETRACRARPTAACWRATTLQSPVVPAARSLIGRWRPRNSRQGASPSSDDFTGRPSGPTATPGPTPFVTDRIGQAIVRPPVASRSPARGRRRGVPGQTRDRWTRPICKTMRLDRRGGGAGAHAGPAGSAERVDRPHAHRVPLGAGRRGGGPHGPGGRRDRGRSGVLRRCRRPRPRSPRRGGPL